MPTNEERREVALVLRKIAVECDGVSDVIVERILDLESDDRFIGGSVLTSASVLHVADLIEPLPERTCRVVPMDAAGNPPYRKGIIVYNAISDGCSECGYPFDTLNRGVPNYCRNCGAKVVGE